jgi:uncharacterized protein with von Willebrand factor type A (vWA) domain
VAVLAKLKDLAARAGRFLGLPAAPAAPVQAVAGDRFDTMTWRDTYAQAAGLRELAEDLGEKHDYAADLLADVFLAAYKAAPQLREQAEMDPSRLVNHQVISSLLGSPEFAGLRRETAGDPYASAMAVIAQGPALRRMLERAEQAQQAADAAAQARRDAEAAAQEAAAAMEQAAAQADPEGTIPAGTAEAAGQAISRAEQAAAAAQAAAAEATRALAAAAPGIRAAARAAAAKAAGQAREEAALMAAWGVGPGELQRMSFEQRARLAERLRTGRIGRFAGLIGRFRQMAAGQRARKTEGVPGELVGITLGDDLGRLIPSEMAALGVPALRAAFAARYAERRLFVYEQRGEEHTGQGAIIACVDCSGSMGSRAHAGSPVTGEAWAKACALALLDQARAGRRDFAGILFSSPGEHMTFRFPAARPARIGDVLDFAEFFYGGGTDFATPLDAAADLLEAEYNADGRMRGDIVLITDGECEVTEEWMRAWNDRKHRLGYRVFGVAVGTGPGPVLDALSDNLRTITDLTTPDAASDIFRVT